QATRDVRRALKELQDQAREIAGRYQGRLKRLNTKLQGELAPLHKRLEAVRQAMQETAEGFQLELPARPEAEVERGKEDHWLYDSGREYLDQLGSYQRHKGGISEGP